MIRAPIASPGQVVSEGPERIRNEHRWQVRLTDGSRAVLAQLLPELAGDESVRRRYVYEAERLAALKLPCVAEVRAIGPAPDPRDPAAEPPFRLRADPPGQTLDAWLKERAPAPVEEALSLAAALADAMHTVHGAGAVLRDVEPRSIVLADAGAAGAEGARGATSGLVFTDIGLARLEILSTRTASSLILDSSPYAAPEHLRATIVDPRADVYTLGVILWQALTGALPWEAGAIFARHPLPPLSSVCADAPESLDSFLARMLAEDREARPESAAQVAAVLRGEPAPELGLVHVLSRPPCQACGAPMRPGLRLCLSCGKTAVQFRHLGDEGAGEANGTDVKEQSYTVYLTSLKEDEAFLRQLRALLDALSEDDLPPLNFLIGDRRMYSKEERSNRIALPAPLFTDVSKETAERLRERFARAGINVSIELTYRAARSRRRARKAQIAGTGGVVLGGVASAVGIVGAPVAAVLMVGGIAALFVASIVRRTSKDKSVSALAGLRRAPAALPASDPLVRRMAELLAIAKRGDVREQVANLALLIQRLCDHRAAVLARRDEAARAELDLVTDPISPLIDVIARHVSAIARIDSELGELDEGMMMRAIAASEARGETREKRAELLRGLDRLRALEDQRSTHMQRLLEGASLLRHTVELGLGTAGDSTEQEIALALAALDR